MRKYGLNEYITECDSCGKKERIFGRELVTAKKTPQKIMEGHGWKENEKKDYCPECAKRLFGAEERRSKRIPDYLSYQNLQENLGRKEIEVRKDYLYEIANAIQNMAAKQENMEDKAWFQAELIYYIHLLSSINQ